MDQTFSLLDIPSVFTLSFLELLLSADNAIVLGLISHSLPQPLRRKALLIGVFSAFFFRLAALVAVSHLLKYVWIELIGAGYLLYLSGRYFTKSKKSKSFPVAPSFWKTVLLIEFFDLAFAIDSIVAGVAFIGPSQAPIHPKLWVVYLGGMLGLIATRFAADLFSRLISRFPRLETTAYLMIAWIGLDLLTSALRWSPPFLIPLFWAVIILLFLLGFRK